MEKNRINSAISPLSTTNKNKFFISTILEDKIIFFAVSQVLGKSKYGIHGATGHSASYKYMDDKEPSICELGSHMAGLFLFFCVSRFETHNKGRI